jgi:RsiW-degrading membrane proteinase PrsW (M82 family)
MRCFACGREVPEGVFCTRCGADQDATGGSADPRRRRGRFAANPDEHVAQPGVMSALFPHLDHDEVNEFRWALVAGIVVLLVLYLAGLITAAILGAAVLVPLLYVLYLYEVRVYRDAPVPVLGLTMGAGIVLGVVVSLVARVLQGPLQVTGTGPLDSGIDIGPFLLTGLLLPIVQETVKPLPALLLRRRPDFDQTIDGLVFGVAAGLGFALAQTVVQFSQVVTSLDFRTDPANWLFPLISAAIFLPLLHGSTTGAITAAVWRFGRHHTGALEIGAIVAAIVVGGIVIYVRYLLHDALLDEAASMGLAVTVCMSCHQRVTAAGFCPSCGMALNAVPDSVRRAREALPDPPAAVSG